ncbi:MAG: cobyric acid synthase, partial [Methyloligellaceae bacterium]
KTGKFRIAVPKFSRIANFDDLDPLKIEPGVELVLVHPGIPIPNDVDLILLPGTKSTIAELEMIRCEGWDIDIKAHVRQGKPVLGICGGYQLLGNFITDPEGIEGRAGTFKALGLLDVDTVLQGEKTVTPVDAVHWPSQTPMSGYQIHLGQTTGPDTANSFSTVNGEGEGAVSASGTVMGTYIHGAFSGDEFRRSYLSQIGVPGSAGLKYRDSLESTLNELAEHLENTVKIDELLAIAEL